MNAPLPTQRILRVRREYNSWVGNETLEDYALRFAPRSFRKWSEARVAITALGSVSFLALEAIGASVFINYGFTNAVLAILVVGIIVFLTGTPISYFAAKHNIDIDLLARGAGFGYLGSTITSLIYASFTFIFFALEAAIMAVGIKLAIGLPLWLGYILCSLLIIPLVTHGVTLINRIQYVTFLPWVVLMFVPYLYLLSADTSILQEWTTYQGRYSSTSEFHPLYFGLAATVSFSLIAQIGEQVDFLRFLPEKQKSNTTRWWFAVLAAGPGWILPGILKQLGGALLAFLALQHQVLPEAASDPTQMYLSGYSYVFAEPRFAIAATALFVILSQIKINITNAYAGSLAWSNFFSRLTHSHPGRVVWLVFNVGIALLLMELGLFGALEQVLGLYACVAIAWVGALVADLVINKPLGLSPPGIEFRRAYLYNINPVGVGATLIASVISILSFLGSYGPYAQAFAPFLALISSLILAPLIAFITRGRFYLARVDAHATCGQSSHICCICDNAFEHDDMAHCPAYAGTICSLCCTLDARCQDLCKRPLPPRAKPVSAHKPELVLQGTVFKARLLDYVTTFLAIAGTITVIIILARYHALPNPASIDGVLTVIDADLVLFKVWITLLLLTGIAAWWLVLTKESRAVAQEESTRQTQLLLQEIEEHRKTDAKLIEAKNSADSANRAKSKFLSGMSHELRSPMNSILGYAEMLKNAEIADEQQRNAVAVILQSSEHLLTLIEDTLDLAKIEAGKFKLQPREVDFPALLRQIIDMFRPQAASKGLQFEIIVEHRLPQYVRVDERRLRQILINLLSNAVKYTDAGLISLYVRYSGNSVTLQVKDTGPGIAEEDLGRIFEPFQRATRQHRAAADGTGLGLSICKLLLHQMGGELTVETELGRGSTFQVRMFLPAVTKANTTATSLHTVTGYEGRQRHVLVVDDQREHRQVLVNILDRLGFKVTQAAYGLECLARIRDFQPDIILLDLVMPGLSGWEVARLLRQQEAYQGPVIAVSANAFEEDRDLSIASGCNGFVPKPVQLPYLLEQLQIQLGLTWKDAPTTPSRDQGIEAKRFPPPPYHYLTKLEGYLQIGYVKGIIQTSEALRNEGPEHIPLASHLKTLAREFRLAELRKCIECYAHGNFQHEHTR